MAFAPHAPSSSPPRFFEGLRFVVELGALSTAKKKEIAGYIEGNGGTLDFALSSKVNIYFLSSSALPCPASYLLSSHSAPFLR